MDIQIQSLGVGTFTVNIKEDDTVADLRRKVGDLPRFKGQNIRLIQDGRILTEADSVTDIGNKGPVLAMSVPGKQDLSLEQFRKEEASTSGGQGDTDDDVKFKLPANASKSRRRLANFLQRRLHVPDVILILLFSISMKAWILAFLWIMGAPLASHMGVGPIYVLGTIFALIFVNLGSRKDGEASAYSIFNNFRALPGQLTADELDRQARTGQM